MSCFEGPGWMPAEMNNDREPFLAENTFYARNTSRIFDPSRLGDKKTVYFPRPFTSPIGHFKDPH